MSCTLSLAICDAAQAGQRSTANAMARMLVTTKLMFLHLLNELGRKVLV